MLCVVKRSAMGRAMAISPSKGACYGLCYGLCYGRSAPFYRTP